MREIADGGRPQEEIMHEKVMKKREKKSSNYDPLCSSEPVDLIWQSQAVCWRTRREIQKVIERYWSEEEQKKRYQQKKLVIKEAVMHHKTIIRTLTSAVTNCGDQIDAFLAFLYNEPIEIEVPPEDDLTMLETLTDELTYTDVDGTVVRRSRTHVIGWNDDDTAIEVSQSFVSPDHYADGVYLIPIERLKSQESLQDESSFEGRDDPETDYALLGSDGVDLANSMTGPASGRAPAIIYESEEDSVLDYRRGLLHSLTDDENYTAPHSKPFDDQRIDSMSSSSVHRDVAQNQFKPTVEALDKDDEEQTRVQLRGSSKVGCKTIIDLSENMAREIIDLSEEIARAAVIDLSKPGMTKSVIDPYRTLHLKKNGRNYGVVRNDPVDTHSDLTTSQQQSHIDLTMYSEEYQ